MVSDDVVLVDESEQEAIHTHQPSAKDFIVSKHYRYGSPDSNSTPCSQMRLQLSSTALTCDRFGISDRATAAIASSVLKDDGIITKSDTTRVVDKSKIRRERARTRSSLKDSESNIILRGLYFDGRKDNTLFVEAEGSKRFRRVMKEEHIALLQEPGSKYISHIIPTTGSAKHISDSIIAKLTELDISFTDWGVVGCDGTVVNTGWKNGVNHNLETHLKRPLQWVICMLHFNALPFRHLFACLDGATAGPQSFSGSIGKSLSDYHKLPVRDFERIDCFIPPTNRRDDLSKDQKYLLDISQAIKTGVCSPDLVVAHPGPLCHFRWLTAANNTLRVYILTPNPSSELKEIVKFILTSYMPLWFSIKKESSIISGPWHLVMPIQTSRYLPDNLLQIIDPVIQ